MDHIRHFIISNPPLPQRYHKIDRAFENFLQRLANRRYLGGLRYSVVPRKEQLYLKRLKAELREYVKTGNYEQLLNIAVYCFLESYAPQNRKFHFDNTVKSVTRKDD